MGIRYIIPFDSLHLPSIDTEILVIGSGNAGLRAAIEASHHCQVLVVTKDVISESNTRYAQGGIAVALSKEDTIAAHIEDTLNAGDGLCNPSAVRVMVEEGIERVQELIEWGAKFDRQGDQLGFTLEAAHGRRRIIHARGDATGEETQAVLVTTVGKPERVQVMEHTFVVDLLTHEGVCYGALVLREKQLMIVRAKAVILAAGGLGQLYQSTSNPEVATGDGIAIAYRAGCKLMDMEFVQFHPTTLFLQGCPGFLISEAVRGEGGILLNAKGEIFMPKYHELADLAPRDVVTRAIHTEMQLTGRPCVYLDVTHLPGDFVRRRFPTITRTCASCGLDITDTLIPVRAGAHFMMGGIHTNIRTETNIQGIYACGEVAGTGVHGANRLASNSLLEGLVFGARAGHYAAEYAHVLRSRKFPRFISTVDHQNRQERNIKQQYEQIQEFMWEHAGIVRNQEGLQTVFEYLSNLDCSPDPISRSTCELANMRQTALLIVWAALKRRESRGAHYRTDYPEQDNIHGRQHIIFDKTVAVDVL